MTKDESKKISTRLTVLILQHPQEKAEELGTANLVSETLINSRVVCGLSWANFENAIGYKTNPRNWAVLYLGSVKLNEGTTIAVVNKNKELVPISSEMIDMLEGIVVLDGTWSQAKSLWWRNPWLLKLNRIVINPFQPSLFGKLRKEPRRESVSTLEAVAYTLVGLGEPVSVSQTLLARFRNHLHDYRTRVKQSRRQAHK